MTRLRKYQRQGVAKIAKFNGVALLADEMGLGKSIQALAYWYNRRNDLPIAVVVCPASLKLNWKREVRKHLGLPAAVLNGKKGRSLQHRRTTTPVFIINYEILSNWLPYILELKPKVLIIDEAHYVQNRDAQRSIATKALARKCKHKIALSGTPLTSRPMQLWNILNILNPKRWRSFLTYAHRYCAPTRTKWGWDFRGSAHIPELHRILKAEVMVRRLKKDVLAELPAKMRSVVILDVNNRREYKKAEHDIIAWLQEQDATKAKKAKKARQLVLMSTLRQLVTRGKMDAVIDWVRNFLEESDRKLILFAHHKYTIQTLHQAFADISVVIDGSTPTRHRLQIADMFNNNKRKRILIGNFKAAGTGLNLTAASDVAMVELPWDPGDVLQAEDRAHRIGQEKQVTVWFLITEKTVEEDLSKLIQRKQNTLTGVLDGQAQGSTLDVFDYLTTAIEKRGKHAKRELKTKQQRRGHHYR